MKTKSCNSCGNNINVKRKFKNLESQVVKCKKCQKRAYYIKNIDREKRRSREYWEHNLESCRAKNKDRSRTVNGRYNELKRSTKRSNKLLKLSQQEYENIVYSKNCHYCNEPLPEAGSGLDRKDNNVGYTTDNVVPCCTRCNKMKNQYLTYEEMKLIWQLRLRASKG